jgi:DNA-binding MarR family transcriptional regulator
MNPATISRKSLLVDGTDGAFRAFVHDFLIFGARLETIREGFGLRLGLSGTGYTCLMAVAFLQGTDGVGVNAIACHLHLSPAFITLEIAKLVDAGLVLKRTDGRDRRRVLLTLSAKGREGLEILSALQVPVNDVLFGCINSRDFSRLRQLMPKLVQCSESAVELLESGRALKSGQNK